MFCPLSSSSSAWEGSWLVPPAPQPAFLSFASTTGPLNPQPIRSCFDTVPLPQGRRLAFRFVLVCFPARPFPVCSCVLRVRYARPARARARIRGFRNAPLFNRFAHFEGLFGQYEPYRQKDMLNIMGDKREISSLPGAFHKAPTIAIHKFFKGQSGIHQMVENLCKSERKSP